MCEYCEGNKEIENSYASANEKYKEFSLSIEPDGDSTIITEPMLDLNNGCIGGCIGAFKIYFCPMCGRKLGGTVK